MCKKYLNREVMIRTTHGTYKGTIVKVDGTKVYLKPARNGKKAHISFLPFLIPLVLFELLAIFFWIQEIFSLSDHADKLQTTKSDRHNQRMWWSFPTFPVVPSL